MLERIQRLNYGQRIVIFALFFIGGLMILSAVTFLLVIQSLNSSDREPIEALVESITINEPIELPDDDSYPAALATASDGTLYTASYKTGVVWSIKDGVITELPDTRERIGSVTGMVVADDGTLYILDRLNYNPRSAGGMVWQITPDGALLQVGSIQIEDENAENTGFVSPDDITVDSNMNLYVTDRGRQEIWRFDPEGNYDLYWSQDAITPTAIAYEPTSNSLIFTDIVTHSIYLLMPDRTLITLYEYDGELTDIPGFDGITVTPDGKIYVSALDIRSVGVLANGNITYLAKNFRGASDVAFVDGKLYVTNFDSQSLVLPGVNPQLPFAIDVIEFN